MSITHAFTSAKSDGGDATLVRPSNWNADHVLTGFSILSDTFNRADGAVGDTDAAPIQPWTVVAGTWDISTNRLRETGAGGERFIMCWVGWVKGTRTFIWTMNTKPTTGDGGLFFRSDSGCANGVLLNVEATYKPYSRSGGSYTAITATSGTPATPANGDVITVTDTGTRITVVVNGGSSVVYNTAYHGGTWAGFRNSAGGGMTHDSIVVTEI